MKIDRKSNTATYTRAETRVLMGKNDMDRDRLNRELSPVIQKLADESGKIVNVYYSDGTMDGQIYPQD